MSAPGASQDVGSGRAAASPEHGIAPRVALLVGGVLIVHAVLAWRLRAWGITSVDDDAGYLLLARALRDGHFRELHDAFLPVGAKFPPGYPALLALVSAVAGGRLDVLLAVSTLSSVGALWCLFDVVRRKWSVALAVIVLALAALNPYVILNAGRLMSEAPFTGLLMLSLWATVRFPQTTRGAMLAGAAAIGAALTRSAGVTLIAAIALLWLMERRIKRVVVFGLAAAVTVGVWTAWIMVAPNARERGLYVADAVGDVAPTSTVTSALTDRLVRNAKHYGVRVLPTELPAPTIRGTVVDNAIGIVLIAAFLGVGLVPVWRRWRAAALFLMTYGALIVAWAWAIDRFLEPLLPLLLLTIVLGAHVVGSWFGARVAWTVVALVSATIGATAVATDRDVLVATARCDRTDPTRSAGCVTPVEAAFFEAARFVARSTGPEEIVVTAKPRPFYYYSGRRAINPTYFLWHPPDQVVGRMRADGADYVLLTGLGFVTRRLHSIAANSCGSFVLVRVFAPTTILLRLLDDGETDPESSACRALGRPTATSPTERAQRP